MSLLRIPTTAAGTVPLVQIQRDCSAAFKILDSAEMDTTVQVWEFFKVWLLSRFRKYNIHDLTFLSTKILRVLFLFFFFLPRALLDNPNYDLHFLFIYLFIYFLDWLSCLHCNCCTVCWSLFFYEHWVRSVDFIAGIDECGTSTHNCSMNNCDFYKY